jgi:hypothetical protein
MQKGGRAEMKGKKRLLVSFTPYLAPNYLASQMYNTGLN